MKKLNWLIALVSVFSLSFVACGGDDVDNGKPAPTPSKPTELTFDIQSDEITHLSASFIVTPSVDNADYLSVLYDATTFESIKERFFVENLFQELKAEASSVGMTLSQYLEQFVDQGISTPSYSNLAANTEYYLVVFGVDTTGECKATTGLFKHKFTTAEAPKVDVTFDVEVKTDGTNAKVKVTPSDPQAIWFYTLAPSAQYAQYIDPQMYGMTPEQVIIELYKSQLQQLMNNGMSIKEAINNTFHIGPLELSVSYLTYNTEYTNIIAGFIIDQDANITLATEVFTSTFSTDDIGEVNLTFDIQVTDIEPMRAAIKVIPSDLNQYFYWQIGEWDGKSSAEEVLKTIQPYMPYTGIQDYTGGPGSPYKMTLDAPDTDYFVIAFGYAPGAGITTEPTMVTFRTLPADPAENTLFDIAVNPASVSPYGFTFNVAASNNTTYYFMGIATKEYFDAEATVTEYNASIDQLLLDYQAYYGPSYTMAQLLASNYYRGSYDNIPVNDLAPGTTYMVYVAALDVNTGHVAKLHTFEDVVTTKSLGEARPTITLKHYSGRDEAGTIFGNAAATEAKAIVVAEFSNLDNARSLFCYMSDGDATDLQEITDAYIWQVVAGYWDSVSIKQPYFFYTCDWSVPQTVVAYAVDKSGNPGMMTRELIEPTLETKGNIEELRALVNELNAASGKAAACVAAKSLVIAE